MERIRIIWKKSSIGYADDQKRTIRALGLKRLNHYVEHESSPSILGMVEKVKHLVDIEKVS
ncbi:MAG: 50S ribosomal protein L30 [Chloroflexi bacterium]|nr:50S ribosomal protein L30 [Chloroflexota bacterium]|tara:strand:+ start:1471 stop:1653 length:183 start_codon:yes stop_codon:yes gene_type:complete